MWGCRGVGLAVLASCWLATGSVAGEVDGTTRTRIAELIRLLGADDARSRDDAQRALVALGEDVRPYVEKALEGASGEVKTRARAVLALLDDATRVRTGEDQTWPGLRGGPMRCGVAGGEIPLSSPKLAWSQDIPTQKLMQGAVVPAGDYVACLSADGIVRAFSKDGGRLWLAEVPGGQITASGVLAAERLVVPTGRGVVALDVKDGHVAWHFAAPYGANAAPAVVGHRVYAAFRNFGVKAFDLRTGEESEGFRRAFAPQGALLAAGDLLVCGTEDGALVRLDANDGHQIWKKDLGAPPNMGPTLVAPGVVVAFTRDRFLRAFAADDGRELWSRRVSAASSSESLGAAGGRVFLTDQRGWIHALDAADGRLLWHRNEGFVDMSGPCATRTAVIDASRGRLTCRDADSGDWLWRLDEPAIDNAAPAISGGSVYVLYNTQLRCYR
jgi:outer membrane protein assembly factor BamB